MLGIFIFFAIPKDYFSTFNLETAAAKVEQDIHYVQELANVSNVNCGIQFVANGSYTAYQQSVSTPITNPLTQQSYVIDIGSLFKNVKIQNGVQVEFNPLGTPVQGGGQTVQITNGTTTVSLLITTNTGVLQVQ